MPTLDWIGKDKVINHHQDVPYRVLEKQYTYNAKDSENMVIHGDNLEILKSLLPKYEGRINCIYIDPPYNTGNEGWVYNDNVNDPKIKKWLGEVVGKEGEDFSRHDKWICMMYPRLKLLQRLLANDGVIFISIDDNELANLKLICDDIFGINCFVSNMSWQRTYSIRNDSKGVPVEVEHILCYSKIANWQPNKLSRTEKMNSSYKNPDGDRCDWMSGSPIASDAKTHQGMVYAIQHPFTGKLIYPNVSAHWRYEQETMLDYMSGWCEYKLEDLNDDEKRAEICGVSKSEIRQGVKAIILAEPFDVSVQRAKQVYARGPWPRFYFTNGGLGGIRRKVYIDDVEGRITTNLLKYSEVGHTDEAKKEILSLFEGKAVFDTPKPCRLLEYLLTIAGDKNSIVLDSFAGSGTTAQAVLNLNKRDGGSRKFILVEMIDYAESVTATRVKRVIDGYKANKKEVIFDKAITAKNLADGAAILQEAQAAFEIAKGKYSKVKKPKIVDGRLQVIAEQKGTDTVEGTGGDFSFYELGELLLVDGSLNNKVDTAKIREYVWYMETRKPLTENGDNYYLGTCNNNAYYFYYDRNKVTTLNNKFLSKVKIKADSYTIYADKCALSAEFLEEHNIVFKKIPRDISRL